MTLRKVTKTQTDTGTWAADSPGIGVDLEKTGLITQMEVTVEITPAASAALDGANVADSIFRTIQNLRIEGGAHTYITLPADDAAMGGTLLHYLNKVDFPGIFHASGDVAAPAHIYVGVTWPLHFGSRPFDMFGRPNPFDLTAFIPAHAESQLRAVWVTSGNDVLDASVTIGSAVMRFTLHVVQGTDAEIRAEMARQSVQQAMVPAWVAQVFAHTATSSDYAEERDVPTGGYLKRIAIAEQDDTGARSIRVADGVTGVALKLPLQNEELFREFVDHWTGHLRAETAGELDEAVVDFSAHAPVGILIKDLRPYGHPDYGLNMTRMTTGAVKLGLTITTYTAGDDSLILYERYAPYSGRLAPI